MRGKLALVLTLGWGLATALPLFAEDISPLGADISATAIFEECPDVPSPRLRERLETLTINKAGLSEISFEYYECKDFQGFIRVHCLSQCHLDVTQPMGNMPLGAFVLAEHRDQGTLHIATLWETPSRGEVVVYEISATEVRPIFQEVTKGWRRFVTEPGREEIVLEDDIGDGGQPLHVWAWNGSEFKEQK
jgi:hypothetical protein